MRALSVVWLFLCCTFIVLDAQKDDISICQTPNQTRGICISIYNCTELLSLLQQAKAQPPSTTIVAFLQRSNCGYEEGGKPLVCCPEAPATTSPVSTTVLSEIQGRNASDSNDTDDQNIGLINQEFCGLSVDGIRINKGENTTFNEYPWMALLAYNTSKGVSFNCAGTLINSRYVLTAAHCITKRKNLRLTSVRLGDHDYSTENDCEDIDDDTQLCAPPYQDRNIDRTIIHPRFGRGRHDIALIRLAQPADTSKSNVQPICLPIGIERTRNLGGLRMMAAGWGDTELGRASSELLKVQLPIVLNSECSNATGFNIKGSQMCAGGSYQQHDSCNGDSGGPLMKFGEVNSKPGMIQYGIISFGRSRCGTPGVPAIYTRVAYYTDWILKTISQRP